MIFPYGIKFSNFRSFEEEIEIPFSKKITYLVGPNNIGKSNILRFLAILFNKSKLDNIYDFPSYGKKIYLSIYVDKDYILSKLNGNARRRIEISDKCIFNLFYSLSNSGIEIRNIHEHNLLSILDIDYFNSSFLNDFNFSSSYDDNLRRLLGKLSIEDNLLGTTYLPNVRFITTPGQEPPQFAKVGFPGETVAFGEVIDRFATMDRPTFENRDKLREQLSKISDFMAFCLERAEVRIEVPREKDTILVKIDGEERPLGSLGTGVEQLMMIGLASMGFPGKLVLIDEPELHLHPRAQKRVMKYLSENVEAQFVVATHSAAVLDAVDADVIQIYHDSEKTLGRTIRSNAEKFRAVRDLGHSPSELLQTKFAVWVEGPSDRIYINYWISEINPDLSEGIDYTILFYGGKVLSCHSFADIKSDLVKAASLSRAFAVVIDSDRKPDKPNINLTKSRIREEVEQEGGFCWITDGREIENYVPIQTIEQIALEMDGVTVPREKRDQVLDPTKVKKMDFARRAISIMTDEWPLDLKGKIAELVRRIEDAA
jgi:predicted ATPase